MAETKKEGAVTKAEPQRGIARWGSPFEEMDRMFEEFVGRRALRPFRWEPAALPEMKMPSVDVVDREAEVFVRAEVPGVNKEDVEVSISGNMLTIKGETKREQKEEKGDYYRSEISRGSFSRTLVLPSEVDQGKAKAEMKDGVLELTLPKIETSRRRTIKIE